jgi:hypothetical protein
VTIDTFLKGTGQLTTFWTGVSIQIIGAGLVALAVTPVGGRSPVTVFTLLLLVGLALALGGFAWNCLLIRCPNCRSRVFWDAVRDGSAANWFSGNIGSSCPRCGFSAPSHG